MWRFVLLPLALLALTACQWTSRPIASPTPAPTSIPTPVASRPNCATAQLADVTDPAKENSFLCLRIEGVQVQESRDISGDGPRHVLKLTDGATVVYAIWPDADPPATLGYISLTGYVVDLSGEWVLLITEWRVSVDGKAG